MRSSTLEPERPDHLSSTACEAWIRIVDEIASAGVTWRGKESLLELYAVTWALWHETQLSIRAEGLTVTTQYVVKGKGDAAEVVEKTSRNPRCVDLHQLTRSLTHIRGQLGLTTRPANDPDELAAAADDARSGGDAGDNQLEPTTDERPVLVYKFNQA